MKNYEILGAFNNLNKIAQKEKDNNISLLRIKGAFAVKKNLKTLQENIQIYQESLNDLKKKYDLTFNSDNTISCDDESMLKEAHKELEELLNCEVDVKILKISEEDFNEGCTVEDLFLLEFMTESEE